MTTLDPVRVRCPLCNAAFVAALVCELPENAVIILRGGLGEDAGQVAAALTALDRRDVLVVYPGETGASIEILDETEMRTLGWVRVEP